MFLKSLELNGFKSFASKIVLEFPRGITAIVGPNGSGKSNIIDAIRWLLGEREAKNLRGAKAENLIFSGTPKRSRGSMASVGLFFDNASGFFSVDFNEVSVVRRMSRDGISNYFLNKSEVRLKDIIDFFAKARLGTRGLTIINQGSSDLFVRVSAEERKTMIEEVLGLREFQIKKSEAERKLDNVDINLEKVKAMIEEVIPRLRMLKRQTVKWSRRAEIEKELNDLENKYFSFKIREIEKEELKIIPILEKIGKEIVEKRKELEFLEGKVGELEKKSGQSDFNEIRKQKNEFLSRQMKIQSECGRLEVRMEILGEEEKNGSRVFEINETIGLLKEIGDSLNQSLKNKELENIIAAVEGVIDRINKLLAGSGELKKSGLRRELEEAKNGLEKETSLIKEGLEKLDKEEMAAATTLEEFNKRFQKSFEDIEQKKEEIAGLESQKQKILFEREKIGLKAQDLEHQLRQAGRKSAEFHDFQIIDLAPLELDEIEKKSFKLRAELSNIGEIDHSLIKEAEETEKHYNFLSTQIQDSEKAVQDLKTLIEELKEKINSDFNAAFHSINEKFNHFFNLMFGGGSAKLKIKNYQAKIKEEEKGVEEDEEEEKEIKSGVEIELNLPKKKITGLEMLSGGEKSLVSIAALFALISVSPPPFLVLDEIDAALDEKNSKRFANLIKDFSSQTQFIIVTHNRAVMESADVLYGVTMNEDGTSKLLSLKLDAIKLA